VLGIKNLDIQNRCLLSKWLFKLINEEGIWQSLLRKKYLKNETIAQVQKKPGDSQFWAGLMKVKDSFLTFGSFQLNDGNQIRIWEDKWIGSHTLRQQYPSLFNIVRKKHATVASVFDRVPLNVSFRRTLTGHNLYLWHDLVGRISHVQLNNNADAFRWNLTQAGTFTVSSMYNALISNGNVQFDKHLWKLKMLLKIKIFMWYLKRGVILTKDNLIRRNWNGNKLCCFCSSDETIRHLFFDCHVAKFLWRVVHYTFDLSPPQSITHLFGNWLRSVGTMLKRKLLTGASTLCWAIWLSRNDIVFDRSPSKTYMQVLYRGIHWLRLRARL